MKIAIMTQPLGHNYGGILQNYALTRVLEQKGANITTINRIRASRPKHLKALSFVKNQTYNRVKGYYYYAASANDLKFIYAENYNFIDNYLNLSQKIDNSKELKAYFLDEDFDAVIVGSDQTWRPKYSPCITNYFLDFLSDNSQIQKFAYASSFGTSEWEFDEKQTKQCKELIAKFDAISVRESAGIQLCRKYLGTEAQLVLDPTLLLEKQDYIDLIKNKLGSLKSPTQEVFNYILDDNEAKVEVVNQVANYLDTRSFRKQPNKKLPIKNKKNLLDYKYPAIEDWLNSFYTADFVVTDSFHGTVLSIIFEKPFITIVNKDRGAARFESLLSLLGLEDRMFYDVSDINMSITDAHIDYPSIKQKLAPLQKLSLNFIDSIFEK